MMKLILKYVLICLSALAAVSCIENDLSYPKVTAEFTSFEVEGQKSVTIDNAARTIDIVMGETADMAEVKVLGYEVTNDAEVIGGMPEYLDLRDSVTLTLHVYEDFVWTVRASQPIERYIRCDNQVGEAMIDVEEKVAYVYVSENQPLSSIRFNEVKLEPEGSVVTKTLGFIPHENGSVPTVEKCKFPMTLDCVIMRYFYVEYEGEEIKWSVKVLHKAVELGIQSVNPWAYALGVRGVTDGKGTAVIEYRKASESEWTSWTDVIVDGTKVSAFMTGLQPDTDYVIRLGNGEITSEERTFSTGSANQLHNLNFDSWSKDDKFPNAEGYTVWDSANSSGAAVTTSPSTDAVKNYAARLESKKAFGLLAAGNIFTGTFEGIAFGSSGAGAKLNWGTPFTGRPLALRGYYKYSPKAIDTVSGKYADMKGETDQCQILVSLADWTSPFLVNTSIGRFVDFDNDPGIIAFGQLNTSEESSEYVKFMLPLVYRDGERMPSYIIIAGASSRYGDYFTGGLGSVLLIDEFELIYDPEELTDEEYAEVFSKVKPY